MKAVRHVLRNFSFRQAVPFAVAGIVVLLALFYMFPVVPDRDEDEFRAMEIIKGLRAVRAAAHCFSKKTLTARRVLYIFTRSSRTPMLTSVCFSLREMLRETGIAVLGMKYLEMSEKNSEPEQASTNC
jgi:hypothetical protein